MRRVLVSYVATVAAFCGPALAIEMPSREPGLSLPILFIWTGAYAGVTGGYGWGAGDTSGVRATVGGVETLRAGTGQLAPEGGFGGVEAGQNWQVGRLVFGAEADIQGAALAEGRTRGFSPYVTPDGSLTLTTRERVDWFGTVRARFGFAFDRVLVFGTGGLAVGESGLTLSGGDSFGRYGNRSIEDRVRVGYAAGAGVEYALAQNWTVKTEYQFVDLGRARAFTPEGGGTVGGALQLRDEVNFHTLRGGVNYRF